MTTSTTFADTVAALKTKVESLHLEQRVDELTVGAERAAKRAVEQAGVLAHTRRGQVVTLLDKAEAAIGTRTEGRYAAQVGSVRQHLLAGLDKLAAKRPVVGAGGVRSDVPQDGTREETGA